MAVGILGIAAAKIFLVFSLAGYGFRRGTLVRLAILGAGVAAVAYGPFLAGMGHVEPFTPPTVRFSVSYPTFLDNIGIVMPHKFAITGATFLIAAATFLVSQRRMLAAVDRDPVGVYAGTFAILQLMFCVLFYHVTEEYFAILAPALTVFYARTARIDRALVTFTLLSGIWVTNLFYGIEVAAERSYVPALFKTLNRIAPLEPRTMHTIVLGITVVVNALVLAGLIRDYRAHSAAVLGRGSAGLRGGGAAGPAVV